MNLSGFDSEPVIPQEEIDKIPKVTHSKQSFNTFDSTITDVDPFLRMEVINQNYNMGKLLKQLGHDIDGGNFYCPFHPDAVTGKPSARYHEDTDSVWCFSEHRHYYAYHVLKLLMNQSVSKIFNQIWNRMTPIERQGMLGKYGEKAVKLKKAMTGQNKVWEGYRVQVLDQFRLGNVSFEQYKNALYKVIGMVMIE